MIPSFLFERFRARGFKWNLKAAVRFPAAFETAYRPLSTNPISPDNFAAFLRPEEGL